MSSRLTGSRQTRSSALLVGWAASVVVLLAAAVALAQASTPLGEVRSVWAAIGGLVGGVTGAFLAGVGAVVWVRQQIENATSPLRMDLASLRAHVDVRIDGVGETLRQVSAAVGELRGADRGMLAEARAVARKEAEALLQGHEQARHADA